MRSFAVLAVLVAGLVAMPLAPARAEVTCKATLKCPTAEPVEAARAIVDRDCPCSAAVSAKKYKKCAKQALKTAKQEVGVTLTKNCQKDVKAAVNNAICGRVGFVPCNKRNKKNTKTTCSIVKTDKCKGSACGAFTSCADACNSAAQPCATTTTTSTTSTVPTTSTSTTLPLCGDGIVNGTEQCDSPCQQGACGAGQVCNGLCQCIAPQPCTCGASAPSMLRFTTTPGSGNCGAVTDASSAEILNLECSGLYFGGGTGAVTLPAITPDMGTSLMNTCCSGDGLILAPTTPAQTGSPRNCTGAGCLFVAPLAIPNYQNETISTCVINEVVGRTVGSAVCSTGEINLDLPLTSVVYLASDLLNGAGGNPEIPGIQPCPICSAICTGGTRNGLPCTTDPDCTGGGTCGATAQCLGGPSNGQACTPGASPDIGARCEGGTNNAQPCTSDAQCTGGICSFPYPTSHDCAPGGTVIGRLPIPFALTTGTTSKNAFASGELDRVFCGFCRDADGTGNKGFGVCVGGPKIGTPCDQPSECPESTCGAEVPCTSSTQCSQPREACEQFNNGAFSLEPTIGTQQFATTISETGSPAGDLTDGLTHPTTLVSVFCIPPTYSPIDAASSLPGPGAVALVGEAQILP